MEVRPTAIVIAPVAFGFVTVIVALADPPMGTLPSAMLAGDTVGGAQSPVPLRLTIAGEDASLLLIVRSAGREPPELGLNVTCTTHEAPPGKTVPEVHPLTAYSVGSLDVMLEIVSGAVPLLSMETLCEALVVATD